MIDLQTVKQGTLETLTITWELNSLTTVPASIVGAAITAVMYNVDTGATTAVTGTLTATGAAAFTWKLSAGDSGTAGSYLVTFKAVVSGETAYTLNAALNVQGNPAVDAVQNPALVGVSVAEGAWVTAGLATVPDAADLVDANDLGTAAYADTGDFDAAGAAAAVLTTSAQKSANLSDLASAAAARTNLGLGTMAVEAATNYYATSAFSAAPTAAEPLRANGSGGVTLTNVRLGNQQTQFGYVSASKAHAGVFNSGYHGFEDTTEINTTGTTNAYAAFSAQPKINSAASYDHLVGFQAIPELAGTANITNYVNPLNSRFTFSGSGIVTSYAGLRIFAPTITGGGTINTAYGIQIADMSAVAGVNYSIYSLGGLAYIKGSIKTDGALSINDIERISNGITAKVPTANAALSPALYAYNPGGGVGTGASIRLGYTSAAYAEIGGKYDGSGPAITFNTSFVGEIARFDGNSTARNTRFMIYDVDNGALERVSVGAPDSGGTGYKLLRIPN